MLRDNQTTHPGSSSRKETVLYVLVNIITFNELWNVTFCHKKGVFVMYGDKTRAIIFTR